MGTARLFQMAVSQYIFKVLFETAFTPLTYFVINYLKKKENTDVYDVGVKYRIF